MRREPKEPPFPDCLCSVIFAKPYDPLWLVGHNIDQSVLKDWLSPKKLNDLVAHQVLKLGDELYISDDEGDNSAEPVDDKITIAKIIGVTGNHHPNLSIIRDDVQCAQLVECHGPSYIIQAFQRHKLAKSNIDPHKAWQYLQVRREGEDLGNLAYVRNAFHLWQKQKRMWEARVETAARKPSSSKRKRDQH